jgi:formate hydrogenlyase subunit 3/multisubunit Na+/H+ antiporter MnhD subunit
VAGGLIGWFRDIELDRAIPAHHLVSVGAWAWLVALPFLLAPLAPFERRWLRWLWATPIPLILVVAVASVVAPGTTMPSPFFERADGREIGLAMSLVGALCGLLGLLQAWHVTREREASGGLTATAR